MREHAPVQNNAPCGQMLVGAIKRIVLSPVFIIALAVVCVVAATWLAWPPFESMAPAAGDAPYFRAGEDRVNVNAAPVEELCVLPGIGEVKAGAIIESREEMGPFAALEDLGRVSGIGPATLAGLDGLVRFG